MQEQQKNKKKSMLNIKPKEFHVILFLVWVKSLFLLSTDMEKMGRAGE